MRRKMLFLVLSLAALVGSLAVPAASAGEEDASSYCPQCTYYANGSSCCVPCWCQNGIAVACTNLYCPPADGEGRD
jgi:hypothetical protein